MKSNLVGKSVLEIWPQYIPFVDIHSWYYNLNMKNILANNPFVLVKYFVKIIWCWIIFQYLLVFLIY